MGAAAGGGLGCIGMSAEAQTELTGPGSAGEILTALLAQAGLAPLDPNVIKNFETYLALLLRWNSRINLTAIRDEGSILARHFVESIACVQALPREIATLLDFGSGAGFPGIPIALCRPAVAVTLAESQGKRAAFLQEAVRVLRLSAQVHRGRAESLAHHFDCVTLRAVDRMEEAVKAAARLVAPSGYLAVMTTGDERAKVQAAAGAGFTWSHPTPMPASDDRILVLGAHLGLPV